MRIDVFIHLSGGTLDVINQKADSIMATQAEQAARLRAIGTQLAKVRAEIVAAVDRLTQALETAGSTTPEVDEATEALQGAVQGLDDLNPDAEPPVEPPTAPAA